MELSNARTMVLSEHTRLLSLLCTLAACLLLLPSVSRQSIWTDEARTARYVARPDIGSVVQTLNNDPSSERQMPGFIVSAWAAGKIFGMSETGLRFPNYFWGSIALIAVGIIGFQLRIPWLPLGLAVHPFLWFYMDEARPYVMQIAGGALLALSLLLLESRRRWDLQVALAWGAAGLILSFSSMLGVVPFGIATLMMAGLLFQKSRDAENLEGRLFEKGALFCTAGFVIILGALGIYYAVTILSGAGGAKLWEVGVANILFAGYELAGFLGLGPGRYELRQLGRTGLGAAITALLPFLPALILGLAAWGGVIFAFLKLPPGSNRRFLWSLGILSVFSIAALVAVSALASWPFWGRHLAPLIPLIAILAFGAVFLSSLPKPMRALLIVLLAGCWVASSYSLRLAPRHKKDDYRRAAKMAIEAIAAGKKTWWAADQPTAKYYEVPFAAAPSEVGAEFLYMPHDADIPGFGSPEVIFLSRPDQFDLHGAIRGFLKSNSYQKTTDFIGFSVWERKP